MKFQKTFIGAAILVAIAGQNIVSAEESTDVDEAGPEEVVIKAIKKSVAENNASLLTSQIQYPITICLNKKPTRITSAEGLKDYKLSDILGSEDHLKALKETLKEYATGDAYEYSYDNLQVYGIYASGDDERSVSLRFTEKGIFDIDNNQCESVNFPKQKYCNDPEKDALINMLGNHSTNFYNDGTYERFTQDGYSKLTMTSMEEAKGGKIDFTLNGKKLNLTRDPLSFDAIPVYTDGTKEYMILAPGQPGETYCYYPGNCRSVPYVYVFTKAKGAETCDGDDFVLAEKYVLNFCPGENLYNQEIQNFTQGFAIGESGALNNKSYSNKDKSITVKFIPEKTPAGEASEYNKPITEKAILTYKGQTVTEKFPIDHNLVFTVGEEEILVVPEGDYDKANPDDLNLDCAIEGQCTPGTERVVLIIRDSQGTCQRLPLDKE